MQEDKIASSSHFITLTYDTSHVPITDKGFMSLSLRDLQLFFKRLRKSVYHQQETCVQNCLPVSSSLYGGSSKIKYYAVGEYGGKSLRPHYHLILFNCPIELIQPAWDLGGVHYGTVSGASIGYCLKYMCKDQIIGKHGDWDDRKPEFSVMSKGLGLSYLTPAMRAWHKADLDQRMYVPLMDGKKIAMPRYYKNKLYSEDELEQIGYHFFLESLKKPAVVRSPQFILDSLSFMHDRAKSGRDKI